MNDFIIAAPICALLAALIYALAPKAYRAGYDFTGAPENVLARTDVTSFGQLNPDTDYRGARPMKESWASPDVSFGAGNMGNVMVCGSRFSRSEPEYLP